MLRLEVICLILIFMCDGLFSYNFDTDYPMFYVEPKQPSLKKSYYGYSIVMYRGNANTKPWIQIGAPRYHDMSYPANCPGSVFRCTIGRPCSSSDLINFDPKSGGARRYNHFSYIEKMDDAWIGGTMDIHHEFDRNVVCGFRWINDLRKQNDYAMQGVCYWAPLDSRNFTKLLPLIDPDKYSINYNERVFYNYAQGQSGFSAHLTGHKNKPELLLGAPGVFNWGGTSMRYSDLSNQQTQEADVLYEFHRLTLNGYAVTSGYFFDKNKLTYVESSPKFGDYTGEVLIYNFPKTKLTAKDTIDTKTGTQMGEYFGACLAAGDINGDGYSDLIVGAPFYKDSKYNEGRIHIFYGSPKNTLQIYDNLPFIIGTQPGGQFGMSVAYLGDFDMDGFGDIAVGAPYEDNNVGTVYIFRGSSEGLIGVPSQIIKGKNLNLKIKAFGISFSNSVDIDKNGYNDVAVGAYMSGHAVILRGKPIIKLFQNVTVWDRKFNLNLTEFQVCLFYKGFSLPGNINVVRTLTVDEKYKRILLDNNDLIKEEMLMKNQASCKNYTAQAKENVGDNIAEPVSIKITQKLVASPINQEPYIVGGNAKDKYCLTCPILGDYQPLVMEIPFQLNCGEDNVCNSFLTFDVKFSGVEQDVFIIGSSKHIRMDMLVYNSKESAYLTKLKIKLPKSVTARFTPKFCIEETGSAFICSVSNPLKQFEQKIISMELNMDGINRGQSLSELLFNVSIQTTSENTNEVQTKIFTINLKSQADIQLTGKSNQQFYVYGNDSNANSTFSQVYQIQKIGKSSINEVIFHMHIPTAIRTLDGDNYKTINFLKVISHLGTLSGRPFLCKNSTNIEYIPDDDFILNEGEENLNIGEINIVTFDPLYDGNEITTEHETTTKMLLRKKRSNNMEDIEIVYTNNLDNNKTSAKLQMYESDSYNVPKSSYVLSCSTPNVICSTIRCQPGPFRSEQHIAVIQLKALLDIAVLKQFMGKKDVVVLTTDGTTHVENFTQSGDLPDSASIATVFLRAAPVAKLATWIIVVAIIAGLLLLLLLILGLIKAGFFNRQKKKELEALKYEEDESKPNFPTKLCIIDFQLARLGSPALDISYFLFTCTNKQLRDIYYDKLLQVYHQSLSDTLALFHLEATTIFPYSVLLEHMKKFSIFGIMMTVTVMHLMLSEGDEVPDLEKQANGNLEEAFNYHAANEGVFDERIRGVVVDAVAKNYL